MVKKHLETLQLLPDCLEDINTWMNLNFLSLNVDSTEDPVFGIPELTDVD